MFLRYVLTFFKILGLAPWNVNFSWDPRTRRIKSIRYSNHSYFSAVYCAVLSIYFWFMLVIGNPYFISHWHREISLDDRVAIVLIETGNLSNAIILLIHCFRRRFIVNTLNRLIDLENKLLEKLTNYKINFNCFQEMLIMFIWFSTVIIQCTTQYLRWDWENADMLVYLLQQNFLQSSMIQCTLIMIYLEKKYRSINEAFISLFNGYSDGTDGTIVNSDLGLVEEVEIIRDALRVIRSISRDILDFFSWPLLMIITHLYVEVTYDFYDFIVPFVLVKSTKDWITLDTFVWLIRDMLPILALTVYASRCITEKRRIHQLLHQARAITTIRHKSSIAYHLEKLSNELLIDRATEAFQIFEIYTLNGSLLTSITNTTITYMIILLQEEH